MNEKEDQIWEFYERLYRKLTEAQGHVKGQKEIQVEFTKAEIVFIAEALEDVKQFYASLGALLRS